MESFALTLTGGNAAMQTPGDVADALEQVAARIRREGFVAWSGIRDRNGNTVGRWDADPQLLTRAQVRDGTGFLPAARFLMVGSRGLGG